MKKNRWSRLFEIYYTFFKLGTISFGGGYAAICLIENEVVEIKGWIDREKIIDIFAVAGMLPGAMGINSSALVGYYVAGIPGALAAALGNLTPSLIIVLTLSMLFAKFSSNSYIQAAFKGIRPAIIALIAYAAYKIGKTALKDSICIVIMVMSFCGIMFLNLHPIILIISGAIAGVAIVSIRHQTYAKKNLKLP